MNENNVEKILNLQAKNEELEFKLGILNDLISSPIKCAEMFIDLCKNDENFLMEFKGYLDVYCKYLYLNKKIL